MTSTRQNTGVIRDRLTRHLLPQFLSYIKALGYTVRDGRGKYEVVQVKVGHGYAAICRRDNTDYLSVPGSLAEIFGHFEEFQADKQEAHHA